MVIFVSIVTILTIGAISALNLVATTQTERVVGEQFALLAQQESERIQ